MFGLPHGSALNDGEYTSLLPLLLFRCEGAAHMLRQHGCVGARHDLVSNALRLRPDCV